MHVVMLSDLEDLGGAAVAASRLAAGLVKGGHRVTRIVHFESPGSHPWTTRRLVVSRTQGRLLRLLPPLARARLGGVFLEYRLRRVLDEVDPDVVNVHNLHGAGPAGWNLGLVTICTAKAPTVWTMHDMWSFTGRCAYNWDCDLFRSGCGRTCPTHFEYPSLPPDEIAPAWRRRRAVISESENLIAVGPSRWLQQEAARGLWPPARVRWIPYGLPLDRFRPVATDTARAALGIATTRPVLLVCAADWTERRKGGRGLREALDQLPPESVCLLTLGVGGIGIDRQEVHDLGYVDDERMTALAYSAADLFVHPAQVDNLPNVVLESIACGTPVVGLPIGGVPDMVLPGITGWMARGRDSRDLADAVRMALADRERWPELRQSCRAWAERHYGDDLQAERYESLFNELLGTDGGGS
jgi:glycosyltransferase involved in cell wall biosynthesis